MSSIHQINTNYIADQDRILLRIATLENEEFALWLTRRIAMQLVDALSTLTRQAQRAQTAAAPPTQRVAGNVAGATSRGTDRGASTSSPPSPSMQPSGDSRFARPYEDRERVRPLGDEPLLIRGGELKIESDHIQVRFMIVDQRMLTLNLASDEASATLNLLLQTAARADWGLYDATAAAADAGGGKGAYH